MRNLATISVVSAVATAALASLLSTAAVAAPASKFAAHVREAGEGLHLLHSGVADTTVVNGNQCDADHPWYEWIGEFGECVTAGDQDVILEAGIKTPNKKDLLIGVSLQNGLYTETAVKGKHGSSEKAGAAAGIMVWVVVDDGAFDVYPSSVVFASRVQELSATLGGVIESCSVNLVDEDEDGIPDSGEFVVARDCVVTDEEIGLILNTTSANHFNFVAPDLGPGDHTVEVYAKAMSSAAFLNGTYTVGLTEDDCVAAGGTFADGLCSFETTDNFAQAWALVDVGALTIEEVRAINQEGGITIEMP